MFRPVHGLSGTLALPITAASTSMQLDSQMLCLLQRRLNNGEHHTYLAIRTNTDYEIVKTGGIVGLNIGIARAQDDTVAKPFPQGAIVEFVFSESAIGEVINQKAFGTINLQGGGIVTVTQNGPNSFTIDAPPIDITSEDSRIIVGGEFPNFTLSIAPNLDCCTPEPSIPLA